MQGSGVVLVNAMSCNHTSWIRLSKRDYEISLQVTDRPVRLLNDVYSIDNATPSLVLLVGNQHKASALKTLGIDHRNPQGYRKHGDVHLSLVQPERLQMSTQPILLAECDVPKNNRLLPSCQRPRCHEVVEQVLPANWTRTRQAKASHIANLVYHRLILPFIDALCLFVDDLGGLQDVARMLGAWLDQGEPSTSQALPSLILVSHDDLGSEALTCLEDLVQSETSVSLYSRYQHISFITLSSWWHFRRSTKHRQWHWDSFREALETSLQHAREVRSAESLLFSATHFLSFLDCAAQGILARPTVFDFVQASRRHNPVNANLQTHLAEFLKGVQTVEALKTFAIPLLASAMILDHFPPGMHSQSPVHTLTRCFR